MARSQIPNSLKRMLVMSLILTGLTTFIIIIMGLASLGVKQEINQIKKFLFDAKDIQPNFERSLIEYTDRTGDMINYLLELKPDSEKKVVKFISALEKIEQSHNLNVALSSSENIVANPNEQSIDYTISFKGSEQDLNSYITELELLPYFIKLENIEYKNPNFLDPGELEKDNIHIKMKLYTRK